MNWHQRLDILRWRSLEEADANGELLSGEKRREATARNRGPLRTDDDSSISAREVDGFFARRTEWLTAEVSGDKTKSVLAQMTVRAGNWPLAMAGWFFALLFGFGLTGIGSEREINLLALPLVGLLLWNAVVMIASVVVELKPRAKSGDAGWVGEWMARWMRGSSGSASGAERLVASDKSDVSSRAEAIGTKRFGEFALPLAMERAASRFRAWLHVGAAVLAMGSCAGMYAKGWSQEYRAVWESTLLGPKQTESFLSVLFWPASKVTGVAVPVDAIAEMQRTGGVVAQPAAALPWIHLYAATLVLLVVMPRLLLAGWTLRRCEARIEQLWRAMGWETLARRLLRMVEGGGEKVTALLHGVATDESSKSRWSRVIQERLGGMASVDFETVTGGDEDEFAASWTPGVPMTVVVFQFATTPEQEVQRQLVSEVRSKLRSRFADGKLIALLDATSVSSRWTPEHIESRCALWNRMLESVTDEIVCTGDETAMNRLRVAESETR